MEDFSRFLERAHRLIAEATLPRQASHSDVLDSSQPPSLSRPLSSTTPRNTEGEGGLAKSTSASTSRVISNVAFPSYGSPSRVKGGIGLDSKISSASRDLSTDKLESGLLPKPLETRAYLHAKLLRDVRPGFVGEIELLIKMLMLDDLSSSHGTVSSSDLVASNDELTLALCAPYAVAVLTWCEPLLSSLGPQVCSCFAKLPALRKWAPKLTASLAKRGEIAAPSASSLQGGFSQMPFREETDSRHHFKTAQQKEIYSNREKIRDEFSTLRDRVITSSSSYYSDTDASLNQNFRDCVKFIKPENLSWFARLFVQQLINVSTDDREFDDEVRTWAASRKGEDKLNKLSRRFEAQSGTNRGSSGPTSASSNSAATFPSPTTDWWEDLFPRPAERFFPLFLYVADSHKLTYNVVQTGRARLQALSFAPLPDQPGVLIERVAACNVLAKFLGFVTHYPRFDSARSALEHRLSSQAFEALYAEGVEEDSAAGPAGIDPRQVLVRAAETNNFILVVPWMIRYLRAGCGRDTGARASDHIKETLHMLDSIRKESKAAQKLIVVQGMGFALVRMIADIDMFLVDWSFASIKSQAMEESLQTRGFSELVCFSFSRLAETPAFDGVPLDRFATTCLPLDRLRLLLISATSSGTSTLVGKSKLRRIEDVLNTNNPNRPDASQEASSVVSGGSSALSSLKGTDKRESTLQAVVAMCMHHQKDIAGVVEFAVHSAPPVILAKIDALAKTMLVAEVKTITLLSDLDELEAVMFESLSYRAFNLTKSYVENLVNLSLEHRPLETRRATLVIALEKAEAAVEKTLRNRLGDAFTLEKAKLSATMDTKRRIPLQAVASTS